MENSQYVIFDILGVKQNGHKNSFRFDKDAECVINADKFINKLVISSDISKATFYLHDSIKISENNVSEIVNYLSLYLSNMMISLVKNSLSGYTNVSLKPTIRVSVVHLKENHYINEHFAIKDSLICCSKLSNGNEKLKKWVEDIEISSYTGKKNKYDVLLGLLQGENVVEKYMALYAYLMSLVKEIYHRQMECQDLVVKYVSANCSRVGIMLSISFRTRPCRTKKKVKREDQFTTLRNKIAHPDDIKGETNISESAINQLAALICCAIEDIAL